MTTQHTQGPWFQGCEDDPYCGDVYADDGSLIAEAYINGDPESRFTNARLIAAAPDLLEALLAIMRQTNSTEHAQAFDLAVHAIAKATGGAA